MTAHYQTYVHASEFDRTVAEWLANAGPDADPADGAQETSRAMGLVVQSLRRHRAFGKAIEAHGRWTWVGPPLRKGPAKRTAEEMGVVMAACEAQAELDHKLLSLVDGERRLYQMAEELGSTSKMIRKRLRQLAQQGVVFHTGRARSRVYHRADRADHRMEGRS